MWTNIHLAAPVRFELTKCRSQSPMPYRLAMGQYKYKPIITLPSIIINHKLDKKSIINSP